MKTHAWLLLPCAFLTHCNAPVDRPDFVPPEWRNDDDGGERLRVEIDNGTKTPLFVCYTRDDEDCDGVVNNEDGCDDRTLGEHIFVDPELAAFNDANYRGYDFAGDFLGLLNALAPRPFSFGGDLSTACIAQKVRGIRIVTPAAVLADASSSVEARAKADAIAALSSEDEDSAYAHVLDAKGAWLIARTPDAAFNAAYSFLEVLGARFLDVEGKDTPMPAGDSTEPWSNLPKTEDLRRSVSAIHVANIKGIRFFVTSTGTGNGTDQEFYMRRSQMPLAKAVAQTLTDILGNSPCELEQRPGFLLDPPSALAPFCTPLPPGERCAPGHCAAGCEDGTTLYPRECNYSFDPPDDPQVPEDVPFLRYTLLHVDPLHRGCDGHECEPGETPDPTDYTSYLGVPKFVTESVRRLLFQQLKRRYPKATDAQLFEHAKTFSAMESVEPWDGWDPLHTPGANAAALKCKNLIRAKYPALVIGDASSAANDANNGECVFDLVNEVARHIRVAEDGLPAFPHARIGVLSYTPHAHVPRFAIEPNIAVNVSTGNPEDIGLSGSFRDQMIAWKQKAASACQDGTCPELQRYLYTGAIGMNLPYIVDPRRWIGNWRQEALPVLFLETTYSSITYSPVLFALGRLAWQAGDERAIVDAAIDEYMDSAFQCAQGPVRRIYERWWAQIDQTGMSEWDFALSVRDLAEAMALENACPSTALEARLVDFADYLRHVHLLKALAQNQGDPTLSAALLDHYRAISCHNVLAVHGFRYGVEPHDFHFSPADDATFMALSADELRAGCRARSYSAAHASVDAMIAAHPMIDVTSMVGHAAHLPFTGTAALTFTPVFTPPTAPRDLWWEDESQFGLSFNDTQYEAFRGFATSASYVVKTQWVTTPGFLAPTEWTFRHPTTTTRTEIVTNPDAPVPEWQTLSYETAAAGPVSITIDGKKTTSDFLINVPKHEPFVELPQAGEIIYAIGSGEYYTVVPEGVTRLMAYAGTTSFDLPGNAPVFSPVTFEATSGADLTGAPLPIVQDGPYVYVDAQGLGASPTERVLRISIGSGIFRFVNIPTALAAHPAQVMQGK